MTASDCVQSLTIVRLGTACLREWHLASGAVHRVSLQEKAGLVGIERRTRRVWEGMLARRAWLPGLTGTTIASSQAGCSTRTMYRHRPLNAADHSGSATGTACRTVLCQSLSMKELSQTQS